MKCGRIVRAEAPDGIEWNQASVDATAARVWLAVGDGDPRRASEARVLLKPTFIDAASV